MMSDSVNSRRSGFHLIEQEEGSVGIEYAAFLAVILVAVVAICLETSQQLNGTYHHVAGTLGFVPVNQAVPKQVATTPSGRLGFDELSSDVSRVVSTVVLTSAMVVWLIERRLRARIAAASESHADRHKLLDAHDVDPSRSRFAEKRAQILGMLVSDNHKLLPSDLKVCDLMTTEIKTALPTTKAGELRTTIAENRFRHILICNSHGDLVGIVSDRDLRNVSDEVHASTVMADCPTTVRSDSLVNDAISQLLYDHISSLPVVDAGKLVGILTTTDVVMTLQCTMLAVEQMVHQLGVGRELTAVTHGH